MFLHLRQTWREGVIGLHWVGAVASTVIFIKRIVRPSVGLHSVCLGIWWLCICCDRLWPELYIVGGWGISFNGVSKF